MISKLHSLLFQRIGMVFLVSKKGENTKVIVVLMMIKEEIIHYL